MNIYNELACLLSRQSPGILNMDVVDISVAGHAGVACRFVANHGAVQARAKVLGN